MFNRFKALLELRFRLILANKVLLMQALFPVMMIALYQFMFGLQKMSDKQANGTTFMLTLPMTLSFVGSLVAYIIGEENEKHNLTSLQLAGMGASEYLLSTFAVPLLVEVIYLLAIPLYLGQSLAKLGFSYLAVSLLSALVLLCLFAMIGLLSKTQTQASIASLPLTMVAAFATMLMPLSDTVKTVVDWTFVGALGNFLLDGKTFSWLDKSVLALFAWVVLSILALLWVMKRQRLQAGK